MIGVLAVGCVTPLGDDPVTVARAVAGGACGVRPHRALELLASPLAGWVDGPDLGPWLKRRKDARLLARASQLALPAAGRTLAGWPGWALREGAGPLPPQEGGGGVSPEELGLFVAVGREPPDEGDAEASLVAMAREGVLALDLLGGPGRAAYPPLLPLRTLPNMVLAHVSIQHGIRGENGTWAGGSEAGAQALRAAFRAVEEGRAPFALVGAAYSAVDLASARDRLRLGETGPPGEAAVFALLGPGGVAVPDAPDWRAAMGDCGPVNGFWGLVLAGASLAGIAAC